MASPLFPFNFEQSTVDFLRCSWPLFHSSRAIISPAAPKLSPIPAELEVNMSRKLRTILIIVAVLIVLVLVVPFLIPVNQFRGTIEEKASAALGRKVQLGNLSLSLLSGSLSAENLSIGDDPKFSQSSFLTAKSAKVGVEMIPLIFSKSLNVTGVAIDSPSVTLIRNPAGQWNYSSLGGAAAKSEAKRGNTEFAVGKFDLKNGTIVIGSTNSQKRTTYNHVDVSSSNVSLTSKFPVTVTADLPGGGKFKLDGNVGPVDEADASLTPLDAKITVSSLNLASTGFVDSSVGLGGLLDLDATLASQNGEAETKGTAKLTKALLVAGGSPASEPVTVDFNSKYNLHKNAGVLLPSTLKIGNAIAHLDGTYQTGGEAPVLNLKLIGENMPAKDLESFLPALGIHMPKGATLEGGALSTALNLAGPTDQLVTTGTVGLFNAKLANFDLGSKMSTISALTGLKTGKDLDIQKVTTNLRMSPKGLKAENFLAVLPTLGNLVGAGTIDEKNSLDFKMAATLTHALGGAAAPVSGAVGMLGQLTGGAVGGGCKNGGVTNVPFLIQGTTSDPKFVPDVGGIAAGMLKSQLGCVGSLASGKPQQPNSNNPMDALSGLFKKKP
jgi:AsmA protein